MMASGLGSSPGRGGGDEHLGYLGHVEDDHDDQDYYISPPITAKKDEIRVDDGTSVNQKGWGQAFQSHPATGHRSAGWHPICGMKKLF